MLNEIEGYGGPIPRRIKIANQSHGQFLQGDLLYDLLSSTPSTYTRGTQRGDEELWRMSHIGERHAFGILREKVVMGASTLRLDLPSVSLTVSRHQSTMPS